MLVFSPLTPALSPRSGWRGGRFGRRVSMMVEPQIGSFFSLSPNGGEGQGEGEVIFTA